VVAGVFLTDVRKYCVKKSINVLFFLLLSALAHGQSWRSDMSWYNAGQTYIKLYYVSGTIAQVDVQQLLLHGFPDGTVDEQLVQVFERGQEIPIEIERKNTGPLKPGDKIRWATRRQTGLDERWAYHLETLSGLSSGTRSLYSDTTVYWLTWGNVPGKRYEKRQIAGQAPFLQGYRDTVYVEKDSLATYYEGIDNLRDLSSYSETEGSYWREHDLTGVLERSHIIEQQNVTNLLWRVRDSLLTFEARFHGLSAGGNTAVKRANLEVFRDLPDGSGAGYVSIANAEWNSATTRTIAGTVRPALLRDTSRIMMRMRVENRSSNRNGVNIVYFDWARFSYYRGFQMPANLVRMGFRVRHDGIHSIRLHKFIPSDTVRIYMPSQGVQYLMPVNPADSTVSFFHDSPTAVPELHIVVKNRSFSAPVRTVRYSPSVNLTDATNQGEFLIITRQVFYDEAVRYAAYRGQVSGLSTMVLTMEDIWDQFDHGSRRPIAIKRLLHYASTRWNKPPRYVFIIGDATDPAYNQRIANNHVPSFGIPPSDDWYAQNWTGPTDFRTNVAIGRLTVQTTTELRGYLSKVRAYERQIEALPWRKRVVMLSGGNSTIERQQLVSANRSFARQAAQSVIAAETVLVAKTSNDPLGIAPRQDLKQILDDGVLLLHFFGHSAPNSWDLLTDDPSTFGNVGRPNIVLSLGCYSGRFTGSSTRIISEQFVFAPNASVAYVGGSGAGQIPALNRYGQYFYQTLFHENQIVLGDVIRRTKRRHFELNPTALIDIALIQNSLLLGDPALRLAIPEKTDYLFSKNPFSIRPTPTNVADSVMRVRLDLLNYGTRPEKTVLLKLVHTKPDQTRVEYISNLSPFNNSRSMEIPVKLAGNDVGVHGLSALIDADGALDEVTRSNNARDVTTQVFSTSADIVYPQDLGIHGSRTPRMVVASPTFASGVRIEFQLDSTRGFNPPLRQETIVGTQLSQTWQPNLRLEQGRNYWWRVRILNTAGEPQTTWRQAGFAVDTTLTGTWWFQNARNYADNTFSLTLLRQTDGTLAFSPVNLPVSTESSNYDWGQLNSTDFTASTRINGVEFGRRVISFHAVALDGRRGRVLINRQYALHSGQYGDGFDVNSQLQATTNQFISDMNALKTGDYVIMRVRFVTQVFPSFGLFADTRILPVLSSIGAFKAGNGVNGNQAPQIDGTNGYILFGKKGAKSESEVSEYIIRTPGPVQKDTVYVFNAPDGDMLSPIAGPALGWRRLQYRTQLPNFTSEASIEVYGYRNVNGEPQLLAKTDRFLSGNRELSLASIDARVYPYVQLKAVLADSSRTATPQLPFWRIQYDPVPEVALDPFKVVIPRDTLQEGGDFTLAIDVNNLSQTPVDTVFVEYYNRIDGAPFSLIDVDTLKAIAGTSSRVTSTSLNTLNKIGQHEMLVQLRTPYPDQYPYNNLFTTRFLVVPDQIPPKMEVYLNNQAIQPQSAPITDRNNPDLMLVGTEPVIEIRWKDENELFLLDDPSLAQFVFNNEILSSTDERITFIPATSVKNNRAAAFFRPKLDATKDSIYHLTVFARDKANNTAEKPEGYSISFRVVSSTTIPSFYPYPNPMSGFTWFAFQLQAPDIGVVEQLRVSIYTLSGKPVRVFDLLGEHAASLEGGLQVGWNRLSWDGRDQDGGLLANGVYLYKVDFKANGKTMPVNNSRGIEKIAIIR
jgi:hypothetical protein